MTTLDRLSRILVHRYKLDPTRFTPDQPLASLGIDSLGMVEMLFFIEEEFDVHLPSEGVTFGTLREAASYLDGLLAAQKVRPQRAPEPSSAPPPAPTDSGA